MQLARRPPRAAGLRLPGGYSPPRTGPRSPHSRRRRRGNRLGTGDWPSRYARRRDRWRAGGRALPAAPCGCRSAGSSGADRGATWAADTTGGGARRASAPLDGLAAHRASPMIFRPPETVRARPSSQGRALRFAVAWRDPVAAPLLREGGGPARPAIPG